MNLKLRHLPEYVEYKAHELGSNLEGKLNQKIADYQVRKAQEKAIYQESYQKEKAKQLKLKAKMDAKNAVRGPSMAQRILGGITKMQGERRGFFEEPPKSKNKKEGFLW